MVYTHGGKFVAVVEFVGKYFYSRKNLCWRKGGKSICFPIRIKFKLIHESKNPTHVSFSVEVSKEKAKWVNPNFIDVFIADKRRTWNRYLQVSIISIIKEDFYTISSAIMKS